ncbi:unnamed protein product [Allacma fusca]|uniref:Uncharacterized protein n=1 Tax=Allacma fusca TaxID=39272 RepID=A0A8J2JGC4_9HEXA|nr:unnamed protein product [Allacma fusca]
MNPCCCMSLRTGGMIIGVLEIILFALGFVTYGGTVAGMAYAHSLNSTALEHALNQTKITVGDSDPMQVTDYQGIFVICTLMTVVCLVQLLVGIILVVGIKKESLTLLKTWMGVKCLALMLSGAMMIVSMQHKFSDASSVITDFLTVMIGIYCFVVVFCLAQEYKKGGNGSTVALHRKT